MTTTQLENYEKQADGPLVLYIELLRQNQQPRPLTQDQLAAESGIPRSRIGRYERARTLPGVLKHLVALSYALGVPTIEALIAPEVREAVLEDVDRHREKLGLPPLRATAIPIGDASANE
jgi:transcriptional regulator with XRE-family HTH domain